MLVKSADGNEHLDPLTLTTKALPTDEQYTSLLRDSFANNKQRYGEIVSISGEKATTSTGVEVKLDWDRLALRQKGQDTYLINMLYKIHYLQWTPFKGVNQVLGIIGLLLLVTLTVLGLKLYIGKRR